MFSDQKHRVLYLTSFMGGFLYPQLCSSLHAQEPTIEAHAPPSDDVFSLPLKTRSLRSTVSLLRNQGMQLSLTGDDNFYDRPVAFKLEKSSFWDTICRLSETYSVYPRCYFTGDPDVKMLSDEDLWPKTGCRIYANSFVNSHALFHAERRGETLVVLIWPTPRSIGSEVLIADVSIHGSGRELKLKNGQLLLDDQYGVWSWQFPFKEWTEDAVVSGTAFFLATNSVYPVQPIVPGTLTLGDIGALTIHSLRHDKPHGHQDGEPFPVREIVFKCSSRSTTGGPWRDELRFSEVIPKEEWGDVIKSTAIRPIVRPILSPESSMTSLPFTTSDSKIRIKLRNDDAQAGTPFWLRTLKGTKVKFSIPMK